jgi:hypothetical protein
VAKKVTRHVVQAHTRLVDGHKVYVHRHYRGQGFKPRREVGLPSRYLDYGGVNKEKKDYLAVWGSGYYKPQQRFVNAEFFTMDKGYDPEDIMKILSLRQGETWTADDLAVHFVTRVTDDED